VKRIVPEQGYQLKDPPEVADFTHTLGVGGEPLLQTARLFDVDVVNAKAVLAKQIEDNLDTLIKHYSQKKTPYRIANDFQVHKHKLLDGFQGDQIPKLLLDHDLAWPGKADQKGQARPEPEQDVWLAMHPKLGSAIMSTLALAIAENEGLDIVTPDNQVHRTLLAENATDVFNALLNLPVASKAPLDDDLADELGQLVLMTKFNYSMLTATQIQMLLNEKRAHKDFRNRLVEIIEDIPSGIGPEERIKRLKKKEGDILDEWTKHTKLLPDFLTAFGETAPEEVGKSIAEHLPELFVGGGAAAEAASNAHPLIATAGFTLMLLTGAAIKIWKGKRPLRFLSKVDRMVDRSWHGQSSWLFAPQWSRLAV
jgi:hypothetical protein